MAEWQQILTDFHWLRPWWLLALPFGILLLWLGRNGASAGDWGKVIDPRWLPLMLESRGQPTAKRRSYLGLWILALTLACLALAGPTWQQLPQPLHRDQSALVVMLDLSPSMAAQDIKPDRITRARFKLQDILQQRNEGQTALIVYAGSAHLVTPLTDDNATIASQLAVLTPALLSAPGSNTEAAFDLALKILKNSGVSGGDLLLISDGVAASARTYIQQQLRGSGLRLSILGVGSEQGAPIPLADGSFAKDSGGNIVMPTLSRQPLAQLAQNNGGQYSDLTADSRDLELLLGHINSATGSPLGQQRQQLERTFDSWHDQGYWLALLLLPLALLAFRKGLVACLLLAPLLGLVLGLVPSTSVQADDKPSLPERFSRQLPDFLKTPDQRGQDAFRNQQYEQAAEQFRSPQWRGSAAYRQGDYRTALEAFQQDNSADGLYNQGNALARLGELDKAIDAYNQALQKNPQHQNATANKALLEQLKQQQQQEQSQDSGSPQDNQSENSESQNDESQQQDAEKNNSEQQNNNESDQQNQQQQQNEQQNEQQSTDGEPSQQDDQQQPSQGTSQKNSDEEAERAMEQFLRKVPDNPGAFLKEKFRRQQQRQQPQQQPERW
ncbi:vWA domain-containing protein [Porticoccus sp. GXU_MW_L64]